MAERIITDEDLRKTAATIAQRHFQERGESLYRALVDPRHKQCYGGITQELLKFSPEERLSFLSRLFGPEGANFPNWQDLVAYLFRVGSIKFEANQGPTEGFVQEKIDRFMHSLNQNSVKIKIISQIEKAVKIAKTSPNYQMGNLLQEAENHFLGAADTSGRVQWLRYARGATSVGAASLTLGRMKLENSQVFDLRVLNLGATWIVVQDVVRGNFPENPAPPLITLWEQDVYPIGIIRGNFSKNFPVYVPQP